MLPLYDSKRTPLLNSRQEEIHSISKRRSEFEHKICSRDSQASTFAHYVTYEMNLDSLRRKRVKRLGVKFASHSGPRRIFFIFDRATRKFPGDIGLWMQYLSYSRKQKASKKVSQILTSVLRMHPTKSELWTYAAGFAIEEHADMTEARSYLQRGLRFCKSSQELWLEYFRLELIYITKITARRRILGVDRRHEMVEGQPAVDMSADVVVLPEDVGEDIAPSLRQYESNEANLQDLDGTPVLSGAIPVAVFDAAMAQFPTSDSFGKSFFDVASSFEQLPRLRAILVHIADWLMERLPWSLSAQICNIKVVTSGLGVSSPDFPKALGEYLKRIKLYRLGERTSDDDKTFMKEIRKHLSDIRTEDLLDPALDRVIRAQLKSLEKAPSG